MAQPQIKISRDPRLPVTFEAPDATATVITWEFVVDRCQYILQPIIDDLSLINTDLERINNRVQEWLDEQNGGQ